MVTGRDLRRACDGVLRSHLDKDEEVLAVGTCTDVSESGWLMGGGGWTYVMVTNRSLRWVPGLRLNFEAVLGLDDVTGASERTSGHRYTIAMNHPRLYRPWLAPAHRFLMFQWGNKIEDRGFTRTALEFSRRETVAAKALREELRKRGLALDQG